MNMGWIKRIFVAENAPTRETMLSTMRDESTETLLSILRENDRNKWRDEAFDVARQVLSERGVQYTKGDSLTIPNTPHERSGESASRSDPHKNLSSRFMARVNGQNEVLTDCFFKDVHVIVKGQSDAEVRAGKAPESESYIRELSNFEFIRKLRIVILAPTAKPGESFDMTKRGGSIAFRSEIDQNGTPVVIPQDPTLIPFIGTSIDRVILGTEKSIAVSDIRKLARNPTEHLRIMKDGKEHDATAESYTVTLRSGKIIVVGTLNNVLNFSLVGKRSDGTQVEESNPSCVEIVTMQNE